jgi:hypothetical protein
MTVAHQARLRQRNAVGEQHFEGPISRNTPARFAAAWPLTCLNIRRGRPAPRFGSRQLGGVLPGSAPTGKV